MLHSRDPSQTAVRVRHLGNRSQVCGAEDQNYEGPLGKGSREPPTLGLGMEKTQN